MPRTGNCWVTTATGRCCHEHPALATPAQVRREVHRTSKGVRRYFVAAIVVVALGAILDLAVPMATG